MSGQPLEGISVLDFTHGVAGPYATMILADLGALVLKVEKPGRGDATRYMNVSERFAADIPRSGGDYFLAINRNKKGITLDLSTEKGRDIALRLAQSVDVVVQSFRPGVMGRLGLGYEEIRKVNPMVIYGDVSGYGLQGPLADQPGMDVVVQARSGVMSITGYPGTDPVKCGASLSDFSGGVHMAIALLAALFHRTECTEGQQVNVSLLDATMSMLSNYSVAVLDGDAKIGPMGSGHPQLVPFQAFPASDGYIVLGCGTNKLFGELCTALGLPELQHDERFVTNPARVKNREALVPLISEQMRMRRVDEWIDVLCELRIPCAPVNGLDEAMRQEQLAANEMVVEVPHPTYGCIHVTGVPYKFSETTCGVRSAPPLLGEHTDEVLRSRLQMAEEELIDLRAMGAI